MKRNNNKKITSIFIPCAGAAGVAALAIPMGITMTSNNVKIYTNDDSYSTSFDLISSVDFAFSFKVELKDNEAIKFDIKQVNNLSKYRIQKVSDDVSCIDTNTYQIKFKVDKLGDYKGPKGFNDDLIRFDIKINVVNAASNKVIKSRTFYQRELDISPSMNEGGR